VHTAVLAATIDVLLDRGIDGLTIAEIAERAGVHETTVYRRWGTKANLALEAVLSTSILEIPAPNTNSLRGDLLALLRGVATFARTPLGEILLRIALRQDLPEYDDARATFWAERYKVAYAALERAEARGELRPGVDYRLTYQMLIGPLHEQLLVAKEPLYDGFLESVVDQLLTGIATGHA
jgi:AcrR family transcriptional regulator